MKIEIHYPESNRTWTDTCDSFQFGLVSEDYPYICPVALKPDKAIAFDPRAVIRELPSRKVLYHPTQHLDHLSPEMRQWVLENHEKVP